MARLPLADEGFDVAEEVDEHAVDNLAGDLVERARRDGAEGFEPQDDVPQAEGEAQLGAPAVLVKHAASRRVC